MSWTEAQVDELINNVRRDFALSKLNRLWGQKLREHGVSLRDAERAIGKHSYIGKYENKGLTIGFLLVTKVKLWKHWFQKRIQSNRFNSEPQNCWIG